MENRIQELEREKEEWEKERESFLRDKDSRAVNNEAYDSGINESQYEQRIDAQTTKIQTLLELLEKAQMENS